MKNNIRYVAAVLIEADSAIAINSGDRSLLLDNAIARDATGLPYLPGTSIAGMMRHLFESTANNTSLTDKLFGYGGSSADNANKEGQGSCLIISDAQLTTADGKSIIDGLCKLPDDNYLNLLVALPQRDHVRLNHRGAAKEHNKYDREVVPKGVRFGFEIEFIGDDSQQDRTYWNTILELLLHPLFRLGSGTRNGGGKFKVVEIKETAFDLTDAESCQRYLDKSAGLNNTVRSNGKTYEPVPENFSELEQHTLSLCAEDFFLFGTSLADRNNQVDNGPKWEAVINWENDTANIATHYLLPATSIKGALSHRVAYHYNRITKTFIGAHDPTKIFNWNLQRITKGWNVNEELEAVAKEGPYSPAWQELKDKIADVDFNTFCHVTPEWLAITEEKETAKAAQANQLSNITGENNEAVKFWFGTANDTNEEVGRVGRVLIDDLYVEEEKCDEKIFYHVKIDRLTGGYSRGALFQELALSSDEVFDLHLTIVSTAEDKADSSFDEYKEALTCALDDLKSGRLPLGGATTKGYGVFKECISSSDNQ